MNVLNQTTLAAIEAEMPLDKLIKKLLAFVKKQAWMFQESEREDVVQTALTVALQKEFKGPGKPSVWVHGIALNIIRNHQSKFASHLRFNDTGEFVQEDVVSQTPSPCELLEQVQMGQAVGMAYERLSPSHKQAVDLRADGLTMEQIADVLHIPVGTVKSRLSRARIAVYKAMA